MVISKTEDRKIKRVKILFINVIKNIYKLKIQTGV